MVKGYPRAYGRGICTVKNFQWPLNNLHLPIMRKCKPDAGPRTSEGSPPIESRIRSGSSRGRGCGCRGRRAGVRWRRGGSNRSAMSCCSLCGGWGSRSSDRGGRCRHPLLLCCWRRQLGQAAGHCGAWEQQARGGWLGLRGRGQGQVRGRGRAGGRMDNYPATHVEETRKLLACNQPCWRCCTHPYTVKHGQGCQSSCLGGAIQSRGAVPAPGNQASRLEASSRQEWVPHPLLSPRRPTWLIPAVVAPVVTPRDPPRYPRSHRPGPLCPSHLCPRPHPHPIAHTDPSCPSGRTLPGHLCVGPSTPPPPPPPPGRRPPLPPGLCARWRVPRVGTSRGRSRGRRRCAGRAAVVRGRALVASAVLAAVLVVASEAFTRAFSPRSCATPPALLVPEPPPTGPTPCPPNTPTGLRHTAMPVMSQSTASQHALQQPSACRDQLCR